MPKLIALKAVMLFSATSIAVIAAMFFTIDIANFQFSISLALGYAFLLLWLIRLVFSFPVSEMEILLLLASDVLVLFLLIGATGGGQNPFTSSLLIPLALSIALLKKRLSFILVLSAIAIYAYWTFSSSTHMGHADHNAFSLHLYGMWINFLVSAILLFVFIAYAMDSIKDREKQLQLAREKILNDEKLVTIATVAASTSHALGSPLSTMAILLEEAESDGQLDEDSIQLLQQQIVRCKQHLSHIADTARALESGDREPLAILQLLQQIKEHFQVVSPNATISFPAKTESLDGSVFYNVSLFMAIVNLFDNAIQASRTSVIVEAQVDKSELCLSIIDDGPGVDPRVQAKLGQVFISTKTEGWGLGVYLANSTIEQFQGRIILEKHSAGGTLTKIFLPLTTEKS